MWVLDLKRAVLKWFVSPESIPGGYAILSHVWDDNEQSFQDVQEICRQCATTGENPRDFVCEKIRQFCIVAERDGHEWGWADTCCIDKASSAELSEAINSMYRYYRLADTCYAYLRDVPSNDDIVSDPSSFYGSKWHYRGWTLQELIAPVLLVFFSKDWEMLGTKGELAEVLEVITGVPAGVLRSEEDLTDFSIAQRMSWASNRKTTRPEDEAYCLMGIFGINMPTLYGEGRLAFRRLQEEIMRQSIDTTLFAWGRIIYSADLYHSHPDHTHDSPDSYLFTSSPSEFRSCKEISFIPPSSSSKTTLRTNTPQSAQSAGLPAFSITPYGVFARVLVFKGPFPMEHLVAVLFWGHGNLADKLSLGLFLTPCPDAADSLTPLYHCGSILGRTVVLSGYAPSNLYFNNEKVELEWKELYITQSPPPDTKSIPRLPFNSNLSSPFHFPVHQMELLHGHGLNLVDLSPARYSWDGHPPMHFVYKVERWHLLGFLIRHTMVFQLGQCISPSRSSERAPLNLPGPYWATVRFYDSDEKLPSPLPEHSCAEDHICDWLDSKRTFTYDGGRFLHKITLSFTPWTPNFVAILTVNFAVNLEIV